MVGWILKKTKTSVFDPEAFLASTGLARKAVEYQRKATIFAQGDASKHVMYIQKGGVKLSVVNEVGKEAVVAMLGPGDFFGEGCLAGQKICIGTATAITPTTVLAIDKKRDGTGPPPGTRVLRSFHQVHAFEKHSS